MDHKYLISVIMAVYNVEPFLREAVDSLIGQDIGFENIQLIMVDDGSKDGSPAICDEYAARYPDNVVVVHKENGGVASARNAGLAYAQGRFLNFMDSDDYYLPDSFRLMYEFFDAHEDETDMVTVPLYFFDALSGDHWQNTKFRQGSRVIDLMKDPHHALMFVNASLFASHLKDEIHFDSTLPCGEDIKVIYTLLRHKRTMGVVKGTYYMYRRRSVGELSLIGSAKKKKGYYFDYFDNLLQWMMDYYQKQDGSVPAFVRFVFAQEMQWRFRNDTVYHGNEWIDGGILTPEEFEAYLANLKKAIDRIDDELLLDVPYLYLEQKLRLMQFKYDETPRLYFDAKQKDMQVIIHDMMVANLRNSLLRLKQAELTADTLTVMGTMHVPVIKGVDEFALEVCINGVYYPATWLPIESPVTVLASPIMHLRDFTVTVPLDTQIDFNEVLFFLSCGGQRTALANVQYDYTMPVGKQYRNSFYRKGNWILTGNWHALYVSEATKERLKDMPKKFEKELRANKRDAAAQKSYYMRLALPILKKLFKNKPIWLISDRYEKAGDNGEALFRYVVEQKKHPRTYFVLHKDSPDYARMKRVGPVVPAYSWLHKILYLLCDINISSQADEFIENPFYGHHEPFRDLCADIPFCFLQHGVTHNDLSAWLSKTNKNLDVFITTTKPEYQSILDYPYGYDESVVKLTGFPRYDRLYNDPQKRITIMPTWRAQLTEGINPDTGLRNMKPGFENSRYYAMYTKLLNDTRLFDEAEKLGYKICWMGHPSMRAAQASMTGDSRLTVLSENSAYRDVFAHSDMIVTDYSSTAFDFAYLRKPLLYYQTDIDEFFSGVHTYSRGYFDYEQDGFGEVTQDEAVLVDKLIEYMQNGCQLKDVYRERIDRTFPYADQNNSKRVYESIMEILGK